MQSLLYALLPLGAALFFGYLSGQRMPVQWVVFTGRSITPLVWCLLMAVGYKFGSVFNNLTSTTSTLSISLTFAVLTSIIPFSFIFLMLRQKDDNHGGGQVELKTTQKTLSSFITPIRESVVALGMVAAGIALYKLLEGAGILLESGQLTEYLLYLLIFMIGIDIVSANFRTYSGLRDIILVPSLVVIGSILGGMISSVITQQEIPVSLALSSGFGWFSLSGVIVSNKLGATYGSIALLVDLFRELFAIAALYLLGSGHSKECIGMSGATAMDTAFPMIKQKCKPKNLPLALISGFTLSLLAPFLITFFLEFHV